MSGEKAMWLTACCQGLLVCREGVREYTCIIENVRCGMCC